MDFIKFYFEKDLNRLRLLLNFFYLLTILLMTKNILAAIGYHYTFPNQIDLAATLNFIMSGQLFIPAVFFLLYLYMSSFTGAFLFAISYSIARKTIFRGSTDTGNSIRIRKEMVSNRFAIEEPDRYVPGPNHKELATFMNNLFYESFNFGSMIRANASLFFNILLLLVIFSPKSIFVWTITAIAFILFLIFFIITLAYKRMTDYKPFYEMFVNHLENPEKYPQKPIGYSTRKIDI